MAKTLKGERSLVIPYIILIIISIVSIFPFIWTFIAATHTNSEIFTSSMAFVPTNHLIENYHTLMDFSNIWNNLYNSVFIAVVATLLVCVVDSMAGYAFAKYKFKGRDIIFFICTCSMFIPAQVTLIPLYMQMSSLNFLNTAWSIIFPKLAAIFGVFLMRQNFMAFPDELMEAARIDGAGDVRTFLQIVIPTMKPAFASLGILTFVQCWGDYLWPLVALSDRTAYTIPLVLALMRAGGNIIQYGAIMVGACLALIPVLVFFLCFQKNFIEGMLSGAVKG